MKKRVLSLLLVLALAAGATAGAAFPSTKTYTPGQFSDVADGVWYSASVQKVYELGLMNGSSPTTFNPGGMFTVAEALTVAARMHNLARGGNGVLPTASGPWYQNAVDYCLQNKLIADDQFDSYTRAATRAEMAGVIRAALPDDQWKAINSVTALPDVNMGNEYAQAIFDLYNAGVFTGSDDYGQFQPYAQITRAEVAAIVARCADPAQRKVLNLKPLSQRQAPELIGGYQDIKMSNGRLRFQDSTTKKWGYLDGSGNVVIPAQYDKADDFESGYAKVEKNGKYGLLNTAGTAVLPPEYREIYSLGDGAFAISDRPRRFGLWINGSLVTDLKYTGISSSHIESFIGDGWYGVSDGNGDGLVNSSGQEIVPCEYDYYVGCNGIYAFGDAHSFFGIYDLNGVKLMNSDHGLATGNPLLAVHEGNKYAIAVGGTKITEAVYDSVELIDYTSFAKVKYGNQVGLVGMNGEIFAPGIYDDFKAKGKYVIVKKDEKDVGVADVTGLLPGSVEDYFPKEDNKSTASTPKNTYQIKKNDIGKPIVSYGNDKGGWTPVIEFYKNNMYYDEIQELGEGYYACRFNTTWYLVHA